MGASLQCLTNPGRSERNPPTPSTPACLSTSPPTNSFAGMVFLCFRYMGQTWLSNRPGGSALCRFYYSTSSICLLHMGWRSRLVQHVNHRSVGVKKKTLLDENVSLFFLLQFKLEVNQTSRVSLTPRHFTGFSIHA